MNALSRAAAPLLTLTFAFGACGGEDVIDRAELEKEVQTNLTESVGQKAPKATCPDELVAETGKSTRCHMDFPGNERLGITVKVKSAKDGKASFDIVADEKLGKTP